MVGQRGSLNLRSTEKHCPSRWWNVWTQTYNMNSNHKNNNMNSNHSYHSKDNTHSSEVGPEGGERGTDLRKAKEFVQRCTDSIIFGKKNLSPNNNKGLINMSRQRRQRISNRSQDGATSAPLARRALVRLYERVGDQKLGGNESAAFRSALGSKMYVALDRLEILWHR